MNGIRAARTPRISVIIPVRNEERILARILARLAKLRAVEYPNLEIIASVNGSRDASEEIVRLSADVVVVSSDIGVSGARNRGAERASGEILLFADSDIEIGSGMLAAIAREAARGPVIGTMTACPAEETARARIVVGWKNFVRRTGIIRGMSEAIFVTRDVFFERGVRFDESRHLAEIYDFFKRARLAPPQGGGARYVYINAPCGYRLSMRRYEREGYMNMTFFWIRFWISSCILGRNPALYRGKYWKE